MPPSGATTTTTAGLHRQIPILSFLDRHGQLLHRNQPERDPAMKHRLYQQFKYEAGHPSQRLQARQVLIHLYLLCVQPSPDLGLDLSTL
jgi:hypothetical protein